MMNRREFFGLAISGIIAAILPKPKIYINDLFIPSQKQIEFMYGGSRGGGKSFTSLYGIPYHESNSSTRTWLGLERS